MYDLAMLIWLDEMGCDDVILKGSVDIVIVNYYNVIIAYF